MKWFLSHRQSTGQQIALPLYLKLTGLGETAFLDIDTEFDLHDLEKIVELADIFCFIMSPGIFESDYCRKGIAAFPPPYNTTELTHAVKCNKPIVVIRTGSFHLEERDIPVEWMNLSKLLIGSRTIVYYSQFLAQCAKTLQSIRKHPEKNRMKFYNFENKANNEVIIFCPFTLIFFRKIFSVTYCDHQFLS